MKPHPLIKIPSWYKLQDQLVQDKQLYLLSSKLGEEERGT